MADRHGKWTSVVGYRNDAEVGAALASFTGGIT